MFNVGGGELIVIALIALIVLGPQRLPEAARQVGKVMGDLRKLSTGFQNEMKSAFTEADDPTRVAARRNVLAKEAPTEAAAEDPELAAGPDPDDPDDSGDEGPAPEALAEPADVDPAVSAAVAAVAAPRDPPASAKSSPPAGAKTTSATERAAGHGEVAADAPPAGPTEDEPTVSDGPPPRTTP